MRLRRRHAHNRCAKTPKAMLGHNGGDLGRRAAALVPHVDYDEASAFRNRFQDTYRYRAARAVRGSTTSAEMPSLASASAADIAIGSIAPIPTIGAIYAFPLDGSDTKRDEVLFFWNVGLVRPNLCVFEAEQPDYRLV